MVKNKIGRNDPCPCGSGKKFKKCCIDKIQQNMPTTNRSKPHSFTAEIEKYDQKSLIAVLAGLQVYPKNIHCILRLEFISQIVCSYVSNSKKKIESNKMEKLINEHFPYDSQIGLMEDPPNNLFTENIIFHGGNYIIFPGITEGYSLILKNLLSAIVHDNKDYPDRFVDLIVGITHTILTLSNEVAQRLGYKRNMYVDLENIDKNIKFPNNKTLSEFSTAVVFKKDFVSEILQDYGLNLAFFGPFMIRPGDITHLGNNPDENPLINRPFVEFDEEVILLLPGSLVKSLSGYILRISQRYNVFEQLADKFKERIWYTLLHDLRFMIYQHVDIKLSNWSTELSYNETVFKIDKDKIAYVLCLFDDAKNYSDDASDIWKIQDAKVEIESRLEEICDYLIQKHEDICREVLIIFCLQGLGRLAYIGISKIPENARFVSITPEELGYLNKIGEFDDLTLWKYSGSKVFVDQNTRLISTSFIDSFATYLSHRQSFYLSDDDNPSLIYINPGPGLDLKVKAIKTRDEHAVLYGNPAHYVLVSKRYNDDDIPIYVCLESDKIPYLQVVEGYLQPIWMEPGYDLQQVKVELRKNLYEIVEMFSYWIWQITPSLRKHLQPIGNNPITIKYELENPDNWILGNRSSQDELDENIVFSKDINGYEITIHIPDKIIPYLKLVDNQGERLIIEGIMNCFASLLVYHGVKNNIDENEIKKIVDTHAPLGLKKKLFIIDTSRDDSLNPTYINKPRFIQKHDIEQQLDDLQIALGQKSPPIGEVIDKATKTKLCNDVVIIFLDRLKQLIKKFNWNELLVKLISSYESICYHRAHTNLHIATEVECFSGIESKINEIVDELPSTESTAISTRLLIEIVSAEPPSGSSSPSIDDFDEMVAIAYHIINWAMISDHIHLDIFDHEISVLRSGRIGVKKEFFEENWDMFISSKTRDEVESSIQNFRKKYYGLEDSEREMSKEEIEKYDIALNSEFGLTTTELVEFSIYMSQLGFDQQTSVAQIPLLELKTKLREDLGWSSDKIDNTLEQFFLKQRECWEKAPRGFDANEDIWPWRYNRKLSYVRRPLIVGSESKTNPNIFWGPRHIIESIKYILGLVTTGRYKIDNNTSEEMKNLIGEIINEASGKFVNKVGQWFENNDYSIIDYQVAIGPGAKLPASDDLGDIDVFVVDTRKRRVLSIECKHVNYARNPREIANELLRVFGKSDTDESWESKHLRREDWLTTNKDVVSIKYGVNLEGFNVNSIVVTSVEIPSTYIKSFRIPFISYSNLERNGLNLLD